MKKSASILFVFMLGLSTQAFSATADGANREAKARYDADKKLCAEETSSSARMQCLRDARAEYDRALAAVKASAASKSAAAAGKSCRECGKVVAVDVEEKSGEGGALGMVAGGVAGALLGHQVGQGTGKDLATIAGAAGGAYAGRKIEGKVKSSKVWKVSVRFDNGDEQTYGFDNDPGLGVGTAVKAKGDSIQRR